MHSYEPEKHSERKSQNLTVKDYFIGIADYFKYGAVGSAIGGAINYSANRQIEGGVILGGFAGVIARTFKDWRKKTGDDIVIADSYDNIIKAADSSISDDSLQKDNVLVKDMIAYEDKRNSQLIEDKPPQNKVIEQTEHTHGVDNSSNIERVL